MKGSILVVDDDENLRWVTQTQLEDAGYRATDRPERRSRAGSAGQGTARRWFLLT